MQSTVVSLSSSPPCRKCHWYLHLPSASVDRTWGSLGQLLVHRFVLLSTFAASALPNKAQIPGRVPLTTTSVLGTSPQGTMPGLSTPATGSDVPGPAWAELHLAMLAVPLRTSPPRDLHPLLVTQLLGYEVKNRRRRMEKGALPALPAPGRHPPDTAAAFLLPHGTEEPLINIFWVIFDHIDLKTSFLRCFWP